MTPSDAEALEERRAAATDSATEALRIEHRKREVVAEHGPWIAHNIHLGHGVFTIGPDVAGQEVRLRPVVQVIEDLLGGCHGKTVLDLGCMEGMFSIELAQRGAEVVGIEGRAEHVARAELAREVTGLANVTFRQGDIRELDRSRDGEFDLVLALGILYHLDAADLFPFVERMAEVTRRAAIIDTHYGLRAERSWPHAGASYSGITVREHDPADSARDRESSRRSSLDNLESIWLTKPSLYNLLMAKGFSSVLEVCVPVSYGALDRVVLVAIKGAQQARMLSAPQLPPEPSRWSEGPVVRKSHHQSRLQRGIRRLLVILPKPLRRALLLRRRAAIRKP